MHSVLNVVRYNINGGTLAVCQIVPSVKSVHSCVSNNLTTLQQNDSCFVVLIFCWLRFVRPQ